MFTSYKKYSTVCLLPIKNTARYVYFLPKIQHGMFTSYQKYSTVCLLPIKNTAWCLLPTKNTARYVYFLSKIQHGMFTSYQNTARYVYFLSKIQHRMFTSYQKYSTVCLLPIKNIIRYLLHQPTHSLNKIHSWATIKPLHVSAPTCHHQGAVHYKAM
jgi:hypothetical protein